MKHFEFYFNREREISPFSSDYICFLRAIRGRRFNSVIIHRWFNKQVDKDDYAKSDKKELLRQLEMLSNNHPENVKNKGNQPIRDRLK